MDNNVITPTNFNNANESDNTKASKKGFVLFALGCLVLIAVIVIVVFVVTKAKAGENEDIGNFRGEVQYTGSSEYPTMLNVYRNMSENMTSNDLDKMIEKSGYTLKKETSDDIVYLMSKTTSESSVGDCLYTDGYVKYRIDRNEELPKEQEPNTWVVDIEFHECLDGEDAYIMETAEGKYRHSTGKVTEDYDTKEDAILNHLGARES